jgi:hypothetical protein
MTNVSGKGGNLISILLVAGLLFGSVVASEADRGVIADTAAQRDQTSRFNLAKLSADAHVVYVSSGSLALARRMIDGNPETTFEFSSSDLHPTVIVELAENRKLHRVSAFFDIEDSRLDVYLLDKLNNAGADVLNGRPIATIAQPAGGEAAVEFQPQGAGYVAFRWTRKKPVTGTFKVAELGAFALGSNSVFGFLARPSVLQSTIQMTSNGGPDFSNSLGTLAAPPALVQAPQIAPVSP